MSFIGHTRGTTPQPQDVSAQSTIAKKPDVKPLGPGSPDLVSSGSVPSASNEAVQVAPLPPAERVEPDGARLTALKAASQSLLPGAPTPSPVNAELAQFLAGKGFSAGQASEFTSAGGSLTTAKLLLELKCTPDDVTRFVRNGFGQKLAESLHKLEFSGRVVMALITSGEMDQGVQDAYHELASLGYTDKAIAEYGRVGLDTNAENAPKWKLKDPLATPERLGQGAFNIVWKQIYVDQNGRDKVGVFKPVAAPILEPIEGVDQPIDRSWVGDRTGVDAMDPKFAERNMLVSGLANMNREKAQQLLVDIPSVYPETSIGLGGPPPPKAGIIMEFAKGRPAAELTLEQLQNPAYCRAVVWLAILDAILGQGDRHAHNYIVEFDSEGNFVALRGVDNDQSGGTVSDPDQLAYADDSEHHGLRGVRLPLVMDTAMTKYVKSITPADMTKLFGKLGDESVAAAILRLDALQSHVLEEIEGAGNAIEPDEWGRKEVQESLDDPGYSYAGREREALQRHAGAIS